MRSTCNAPAEPTDPGGGLRISVYPDDATLVLSVAGEVDMMTDSQLREHALRMLCRRPTVMVIRLEAVTFLDSRGLAALVAINRRASCLGVRLALTVAPKSPPARVLTISGLDQYLQVFDNLSDAVQDTSTAC